MHRKQEKKETEDTPENSGLTGGQPALPGAHAR